ncbi:MAG: sugar phosphate nucleotidyltransferase [Dehalococcoidia bacterium]
MLPERGRAPTTGVILAAGRGSRIRPLSDSTPKPLLPICNRPMIAYHLDLFAGAGIQDIVIVIGPHGDQIRGAFGDGHGLGLRIRYVVDQQPEGIASSLLKAEYACSDVCVVILGDIFVSLASLVPLIAPVRDRIVSGSLLVAEEPDPEAIRRNFAVEVREGMRVARVVEKPREPRTDLKGCGIYVFTRSIFDAIRRTPRSPLRNEFEITDAIQMLVDDGQELIAVGGVRWDINITSPGDLLNCNLRVLNDLGKPSVLGEDVRMPGGMTIADSVIGDRVIFDHPMSIERSLILADSHIRTRSGALLRAIVAPDASIVVGA